MKSPPELPADILDATARSDRLVGWKDISAYVGKAQRTVQRWEKEYQLPVHRLGREGGEIVFAFRAEVDTWLRSYDAARARQSNGTGAVRANPLVSPADWRVRGPSLSVLDAQAGRITVIVEQSEPHPESAPIYYRFDPAWRLLDVDVHPAYEVVHRQLRHDGVLDHAYGPAEAELAARVRRWSGSGFVDVEKVPSFDTRRTAPTPFFGPPAKRPPGS